MLLTTAIAGRRTDLTSWGRAAAVAAAVSIVGYALQTILDFVPAPHAFKFAEFWGLFAGSAVVGFLAGAVALFQERKAGRWNATLVCGLAGVGWLVLAQTIQLLWN